MRRPAIICLIKICSYKSYNSFYLLVQKLHIWSLDEEMKDATSHGLYLEYKKEEREAVTKEGEELFWGFNLLGTSTAKSFVEYKLLGLTR